MEFKFRFKEGINPLEQEPTSHHLDTIIWESNLLRRKHIESFKFDPVDNMDSMDA